MKRISMVVLAVASTGAFAQDLKLGDLNFFQKTGSVYWNTELNSSTTEYEIGAVGSETNLIQSENRLTYGISDVWNFGAALNYAFTNETSADGVDDVENKGFSDLSLISAYRLHSQDVFVDVFGGLTVKFGDRELGQGTVSGHNDGNNFQGHHSLDLGVAAGQKYSQLEWRGSLALDYHMAGEYELVSDSAADDTDYDTDSYINYILAGQVQYRPESMTNLALGLDLSYTVAGERMDEDQSNDDETTVDSHSFLTTGLTAKYNLSETILVKAGYSMVSEYDYNGDLDGAEFDVDDNKVQKFFAGAEFLF